jgi:hypothetical protein
VFCKVVSTAGRSFVPRPVSLNLWQVQIFPSKACTFSMYGMAFSAYIDTRGRH